MTTQATIQQRPRTGAQAIVWQSLEKAQIKIAKPIVRLEYNQSTIYKPAWNKGV